MRKTRSQINEDRRNYVFGTICMLINVLLIAIGIAQWGF
jgi:hypothetical protein